MTTPKPDTDGTAPDIAISGFDVSLRPGAYFDPPHKPSETNLLQLKSKFRESPLAFLRDVSLHVSGTGWRAYDNVIGQPIFYKGFSENMKANVMETPMLRAKIEELADKRVGVEERMGLWTDKEGMGKRRAEIKGQLAEYADGLVDNMICKMESKTFIRGAYYFTTQLLTRAYHQGKGDSTECQRGSDGCGLMEIRHSCFE